MGEAKRRKLAGVDAQLSDIRKLSESKRRVYINVALKRAKEIAANLPEGDKLYKAFEPMLRFVVGGNYLGGCHDTSAVMYMQLREAGLQEADMALCIGEVKVQDSLPFDHSWVEVLGQVFDVAICAPNKVGAFVVGAVFAGVDLSTNAPTQAMFGVASEKPLAEDAKNVYGMNLSQYLDFQQSMGFRSMVAMLHEVYGGNGQKLLTKYGDVNREWRNPLRNSQEIAV